MAKVRKIYYVNRLGDVSNQELFNEINRVQKDYPYMELEIKPYNDGNGAAFLILGYAVTEVK